MNNYHLSIDEMRDLNLSLEALRGRQDGIEQALIYLNVVHTTYLEVLNTQPADDPLITRRKQEILAEIESLSKLKKEYGRELKQEFLDLCEKYKIDPPQPSSTEE